MTSLEAWNEQFGAIDLFKGEKKSGFEWQLGLAYKCKVERASIVKSQKGDVQIKIDLSIRSDDGEDSTEAGRAIEWFTLPKQLSDLEGKDFDLVTKLTKRRVADVVRLLSAADPHTYALYSHKAERGGQTVFYGFNNEPMSKDAFKMRQSSIHDLVMIWIDEAHDSLGQDIEILKDTHLYIEKVENKKNPKYPYTNIYAKTPEKTPVFDANTSEAPF